MTGRMLRNTQMGKRANLMAVKAGLSYGVSEAAKALGNNEATICNWIKDGLPVMASMKPCLILRAELCDYLRTKYQNSKTKLSLDELGSKRLLRSPRPAHGCSRSCPCPADSLRSLIWWARSGRSRRSGVLKGWSRRPRRYTLGCWILDDCRTMSCHAGPPCPDPNVVQ
jgi:hypothetical protein